jgi:uncharacterized protein (DUF427 family)
MELTSSAGKKVENAGWYYADPYDAALSIKDYVAFGMSTTTSWVHHFEG